LFICEICRGDGVIQRSTKSFPTRIEALLDSAHDSAVLEEARWKKKEEGLEGALSRARSSYLRVVK
jgi:hypothetical protein